MNKKQKKALLIFSSLLFICAVFVIYARTADLLGNYDPTNGYYKAVTALTRASGYATAGGALASLIFSYIFMKETDRIPENKSVFVLYANAVFGFALVACGCIFTVNSAIGGISFASPAYIAAFAFGALALIGCAYFISNFVFSKTNSKLGAFFCVCASLALLAYTMYLYYEDLSPLNSPIKLFKQTALVATTLFLVNEAGFGVGKKFHKAYLGFGLAGAFLTLCDSVPNIVAGIITREPLCTGYSYLGDVLTFAAFLYILLRVISMTERRSGEAIEFLDSLTEKAETVEEDEEATEDTERLLQEFSGGVQTSLFDDESEDTAEDGAEEEESAENSEENGDAVVDTDAADADESVEEVAANSPELPQTFPSEITTDF